MNEEEVPGQIVIWRAFYRLGSSLPQERELAMETLCRVGAAALPYLRFLAQLSSLPTVQYSAAVVLHRLGDKAGLATLREGVQWRLPAAPALAEALEMALVKLGSPDAGSALLEVWASASMRRETGPVLALIARVWAKLGDIRGLNALISRAEEIPDLFLQSAPLFGDAAISSLGRMLRDESPRRRLLAIAALRAIETESSFAELRIALRDPDPEVRAAAPEALQAAGGTAATAREVAAAAASGYSTQQAVVILARIRPLPYDLLMGIVQRWDPASDSVCGDTEGAVQAALEAIGKGPPIHGECAGAICELLGRISSPPTAAAAVRILASVTAFNPATAYRVREVL